MQIKKFGVSLEEEMLNVIDSLKELFGKG